MANTFTVDGIEYKIVRNPYTNGPMIARVDGFSILNRKEICRRFLRNRGWTDSMFGDRITNDLERQINNIVNGEGNIPAPRLNETYSKSSYIRVRPIPTETTGEKVHLSVHVNKFIEVYNSDENGRYLSYDHIRRAFLKYRKDEDKCDLLALNLYAYLASWGMLRNSFLQQKDYKFLIPVVKILCDPKFETLIDYDPFNDRDKEKALLIMKTIMVQFSQSHCPIALHISASGHSPVSFSVRSQSREVLPTLLLIHSEDAPSLILLSYKKELPKLKTEHSVTAT